jgi:hypothetical protein
LVKKKMICPLCEKRVFDVSKLCDQQVEIELKCPNCNKVVKVPCLEKLNMKESQTN